MAILKPLRGTRILSLAQNLPGPAALMRLHALGATCIKLESPAGDPMQQYSNLAYTQMHRGIQVKRVDLKTELGLSQLHVLLEQTDVLLTSFRPSALARMGLAWKSLHKTHPQTSLVSIVGNTQAPEVPGHDLTYMAEQGLLNGTELPSTLFADMGGSLLAVESVLATVMQSRALGKGVHTHIGLAQAVQYLALPRQWGLSTPDGITGGAHAFYQVMPCKDGRVAVAALETHFAERLCRVIDSEPSASPNLMGKAMKKRIKAFMRAHTCQEIDALARQHDLPLHALAPCPVPKA
jgi:alpha-methylacyl-CoA racemase